MVLTVGMALAAQEYEPNTKWPYLYPEFQKGTIFFDQQKKSAAELNIHLLGNVLHFIDTQGHIMESLGEGIVRVEIGADAYVYMGRRLMQVIASEGEKHHLLLCLKRADFDAMLSEGGAYGGSLGSAASMHLSSLDLGGLDHPEIGRLLQEKQDGRTIPMITEYYFFIDGQLIHATRKAVEKLLDKDRLVSWKAFVKASKIKWKQESSLREVLRFLQ